MRNPLQAKHSSFELYQFNHYFATKEKAKKIKCLFMRYLLWIGNQIINMICK